MVAKEKIAEKETSSKKSMSTQKGKPKRPDKKDTSRTTSNQPRQVDLSTEELAKELGKLKAITPYTVASRFEINIGEAKRLLRNMEERNLIKCVGGNSRIRIYTPAAS